MALTIEQQELVAFFSDLKLPIGPQHVNAYSVFIDLPRAVQTQLGQLESEVVHTRQSAIRMLQEVKDWLGNPVPANPESRTDSPDSPLSYREEFVTEGIA